MIEDFEFGLDRLDVEEFEFASVAAVLETGTQTGDDVVFDFGRGTDVTVLNASLGDFGASDFILT